MKNKILLILVFWFSSCNLLRKPIVNSWYSLHIIPSMYSDIISEEIKDSVEVIMYIPGAYCGTIAAASNTRVKTSTNDTIQLFSMCKDTKCIIGSKYLIEYSSLNNKLPNFEVHITNDSSAINRKWKIIFGKLISNDSLK